MNEKDAIEVFNAIMNGSLKQGLDLAGEKMELDTEGLILKTTWKLQKGI